MANPEHLDILRQGVETWNKWRIENAGIQPNLRRANLREANLHGIKFWDTDLTRANLSGADLSEANLARPHRVQARADQEGLSIVMVSIIEGMATNTPGYSIPVELPPTA